MAVVITQSSFGMLCSFIVQSLLLLLRKGLFNLFANCRALKGRKELESSSSKISQPEGCRLINLVSY